MLDTAIAALRWFAERSMRRFLVYVLGACVLVCTACGGGAPRSDTMDMLALNQPTPDPTLDAVVRDLPHALAGVPPTATPTPVAVPKPVVRQQVVPKAKPTSTPPPAPTKKPAPSPPTATLVARH